MAKISKKITTILIFIICILTVYGIKYFIEASRLGPHKIALAHAKGEQSAPTKIIEFVDLQCPACAAGYKILEKFMEEHPNLILLQVKYYPLTAHKHSMPSARYAECAARQEKFWPYVTSVFGQQAQWKDLNDATPAFSIIAKDVGLNINQLNSCLQDKTIDEYIMKNKAEGETLGVESTPTYFINEQMFVGTKNLELELNKILERN